jgi:asparagine synthase (glutamine-hydrolysing)
MCGIAGFVQTAPIGCDPAQLKRMTDAIEHRGPDDNGFYRDDWAALGHRRLSIIDLSGGHQPMSNETGSMWIVYNGEIFNHASLRPELERAGHRYESHCDTETILHSHEQYGIDCVQRYRGMFAFALWDKERRRLFCARDRMGIKPLYYFWDGRTFVFGSEIKALLEHSAVSARFRESSLSEYLAFGFTSGEETMFEGIRKLMPGHTLTLDLAGSEPKLDIRAYWDVPAPAGEERKPDKDWIAECRQRLEETVEMRLMSDVPLGMFLSGGLDSSLIAAMIKRMAPGPVKTFSVGYAEAEYSELGYAQEVAKTIGTDHHQVVVGMEEFFGALPRLVWHEDEPITWPSSVSLHFVSALAAQQVKVVLTGEGSDELFGGYVRYHWNRLNMKLLRGYQKVAPPGLRYGLRARIADTNLISGDVRRKISHSFLGREETVESLYLDNFYSAFSAGERKRLLRGESSNAYESFLHYWNARSGSTALSQMLYADQKTYLVELLMKQDQMSMSTSIESRVPFLDHTFVEFAMRVPDHLKIHKGTQKYIVKEAVADLLPAGIIHRKKMGFPTPLLRWLREPRAEPLLATLLEKDGLIASYLDLDTVRTLLEQHRSGKQDGTDRIWRLLNLQIWGDLFITGRRDRHAESWNVPAPSSI